MCYRWGTVTYARSGDGVEYKTTFQPPRSCIRNVVQSWFCQKPVWQSKNKKHLININKKKNWLFKNKKKKFVLLIKITSTFYNTACVYIYFHWNYIYLFYGSAGVYLLFSNRSGLSRFKPFKLVRLRMSNGKWPTGLMMSDSFTPTPGDRKAGGKT